MFIYIPVFFESICLSFALIYLRKSNDWWVLFIPYLIIVLVTETYGLFLIMHLKQANNYWVHNLYLPIYFCFIFFALFKIKNGLIKIKKWMYILPVFILASYFYESVLHHFHNLSIITYNIFNVFIVLICCNYYYYLLKNDHFIDLKKHAPFWIITGLFFFSFGSISYLFFDALSQINIKNGLPIRPIIFIILNFILYSCWSYAFLCRYRQKT